MKVYLREHGKCFAFGWVPGWAVAIFLSSALIGWFGLSPIAGDCGLGCTMQVADEVSPQAKLLFGFAFGAFLLVARINERISAGPITDVAAALVATLLTLLALPEGWSRGFGIGLTGERFDGATLSIYAASAVIAGLLAHLLEKHCTSAVARSRLES